MDSTPLDLMVVYPDGSTGRVDLTLALDIATRTLCSAILRPVATKSVDAAMLLARALTPLPMQPGWHASLSFSRSVLPAGMIRGDDEVRTCIAAKPVIVPESITIDRGKVSSGRHSSTPASAYKSVSPRPLPAPRPTNLGLHIAPHRVDAWGVSCSGWSARFGGRPILGRCSGFSGSGGW